MASEMQIIKKFFGDYIDPVGLAKETICENLFKCVHISAYKVIK